MNQMKISNLFKYHAQGALKIHFVQNGSLAIFNSQHDLEKAIKTETHADLIFHFCDGSKLVYPILYSFIYLALTQQPLQKDMCCGAKIYVGYTREKTEKSVRGEESK